MPRTRFHRSSLVRVLAELAAADVPESSQPFAERLGQWLDFKDALSLFSVLNSEAAAEAEPSAGSVAMREAFARVRASQAASITADDGLTPGKAPGVHAPEEQVADFAPYRRYYLARQRDMNASITALRASVRGALAAQSPPLRRLAALDAVLEQAMSTRASGLLGTVPGMLARRFEQLRKAHQASGDQAPAADDPEPWQAAFRQEMRAALLAELELRLQPVAGLIAAIENEGSRSDE